MSAVCTGPQVYPLTNGTHSTIELPSDAFCWVKVMGWTFALELAIAFEWALPPPHPMANNIAPQRTTTATPLTRFIGFLPHLPPAALLPGRKPGRQKTACVHPIARRAQAAESAAAFDPRVN